jgi:hypothetical protein
MSQKYSVHLKKSVLLKNFLFRLKKPNVWVKKAAPVTNTALQGLPLT